MAEWHGDSHGAVDLSAQSGKNERDTHSPAPESSLIITATDASFDSVVQLSMRVPVIVDLWATWCEPCKQLTPILEKLVKAAAGRLVLAQIDVDANPQLAQAFQAQSVPTVAALIGGRPAPLFTGALPEAQVAQALDQVLQAAAQMGVTGTVSPEPGATPDSHVPSEPEPELSPEQAAAYAALDEGRFAEARAILEKALVERPADDALRAALAHAALLERTSAPADPHATGIAAILAQADQLIATQHADAAFTVLLDAFATADGDDREALRTRILDYFLILGADDPHVGPARSRLAMLLY